MSWRKITMKFEKKVNFLEHGTRVKKPLEQNQDTNHSIGTRARKVDGADKALGKTLYADDISLPNMLHCVFEEHQVHRCVVLVVFLEGGP